MQDAGFALDVVRQGLMTGLMVVLPILLVTLFVGVLISVFQAATQVQEMTLTFVPKLIACALVVAIGGYWMANTIVNYTQTCFEHAARAGR